jgi:hypothetical protein
LGVDAAELVQNDDFLDFASEKTLDAVSGVGHHDASEQGIARSDA